MATIVWGPSEFTLAIFGFHENYLHQHLVCNLYEFLQA